MGLVGVSAIDCTTPRLKCLDFGYEFARIIHEVLINVEHLESILSELPMFGQGALYQNVKKKR